MQREVFEPASRGRDVVVQARTGTGKTAAFGMPVVDALVQRTLAAVQVLILCPTRELALQVHRELDTLGRHRGVKSVAVYGGAPMARQVEELAAGAQVLAGTPGRVLDHLRRRSLDPSSIRVFILDESDEMLSMGFLPQINEILGFLPPTHQTLLFSATLPADIQRLAETRLKDPLFLTLSGDQIGALDIQHLVYLTRGDKLKDFVQVLEVENPESAIVFCNTRDETKRVANALDRLGFSADWLNADLAQNEREKVMAATRGGNLRFLVCTDVAARGIDISHLTHVINYDLPESPESYVHRTGRTGRAGRTGTAISLIEPSDIGRLYMLRLIYKIFPIEKQLPSAGELRTRQELDVVEMFAEAFANRRIHPDDLSLARRLLTHDAVLPVVAGLLRDHLGARPEAVREATEGRRARTPRAEEPVIRAPAVAEAEAPRSGEPQKPRAPSGKAGREGRANNVRVASSVNGVARSPRGRADAPAVPPPASESAKTQRGEGQAESADVLATASTATPEVARPRDRRGPPLTSTTEPDPCENAARAHPHAAAATGHGQQTDRSAGRPQRRAGSRSGGDVGQRSSIPPSVGFEASQVYRDDDFEFAYRVDDAGSPVSPQGSERSTDASGVLADSSTEPSHGNGSPLVAAWAELFVNVGRVDGAETADFQRLLEAAELENFDAIHISIRRNHSFVRVSAVDFISAESALNGAKIGEKIALAERSRTSRS